MEATRTGRVRLSPPGRRTPSSHATDDGGAQRVRDAFLPQFLRSDGEEAMSRPLGQAVTALIRGGGIDDTLRPTPSPDSGRAAVPIFLSRATFGDGFHVSGLMPLVYNTWMASAMNLNDTDFERAVRAATALYAALLSRPWGVLCALAYDSFIWLQLGLSIDDDLDPDRTRMFLVALRRESAWLWTLDGRFTDFLTGKPGPPWAVQTLLSFLAARQHLPPPTSWASWDTTIDTLLERVSPG